MNKDNIAISRYEYDRLREAIFLADKTRAILTSKQMSYDGDIVRALKAIYGCEPEAQAQEDCTNA